MPEEVADVAVELAVELVRIDSVTPALVPGAAGEGGIVDVLATRLAARGFEVEVVEAARGPRRPSLLAVARGAGAGRSVGHAGHLDQGDVPGRAEPFAGRVEGDVGPGR